MKSVLLLILLLVGCSIKSLKKKNQNITSDTIRTNAYQYGPSQTKNEGYFLDKTQHYGLENIEAHHFYAVDFTHDGFTDLVILPTHFSEPLFYEYFPKKEKFIKTESPFSTSVVGSYFLFYDLNHDHILDLIVGVLNQKSELSKLAIKVFRGSFESNKYKLNEVKNAIPLSPLPSSSIAVLDYNNDGEIDLYVGNWFGVYDGKPIPVRDRLLRGSGFLFKDVTSLLDKESEKNEVGGMYINAKPTYGVSTCDIDQNGFVDILTTSTSLYHNKLWMNIFQLKGEQRFFKDYGLVSFYSSDVEGRLDPRGGGRTFFSACADYNDDGMMDIYMGELTHSYDNDSVDKSSVLTGKFTKMPPDFIRTEYMNDIETINWNQGDRRAIWFDYNFDSFIDLLVDNSGFPPTSRLVLFEQKENHAFENIAHLAGIDIINPTGSIIMDLNQDGKMDIITAQTPQRNSQIGQRVYVFQNEIPYEGKRIIRFYLRGEKANSMGIGSMIYLKTKYLGRERTRMQWVEYSQGALPSQNEVGIVFGLAKGEELVEAMVRWPIYQSKSKGSVKALERKYNLKKYNFNFYLDVTLCESGNHNAGKKACL